MTYMVLTGGEGNSEIRALALFGLHADFSAEFVHYFFDDAQPEAIAFAMVRVMAVEYLENAIQPVQRNSNAVVLDMVFAQAVLLRAVNADIAHSFFTQIFERVGNDI